MLSENLPKKWDEGVRVCSIGDCGERHYAGNLCRRHYQMDRNDNLDLETGKPKRAPGRPSESHEHVPSTFSLNEWIYIGPHAEFYNRINGLTIGFSAACKLWSYMFVKNVVLEKKIPIVMRTFFDPGENSGIHPTKGFNVYDPEKMIHPQEGQQSEPLHPYLKVLLNNLGGKDTDYLLDWLAYGIQNPGAGSCALVLHGMPGAGKGTLGVLLKEIYKPYFHSVNAWTLENEFNGWIENRLLIVADEIAVKTSREREKIKNTLKTYVVPNAIEINRKGVNQYDANNFSRWIICSNEDHPVDVDMNDRRYSVIKSERAIEPSLGETIDSMKKQLAQNLANHLSGRDLSEFRPMVPLQNQAREDLKASLAKVYKIRAIS